MNKLRLLTTAAALAVTAASSNAAEIEFWYGNTGTVEAAILAECTAFNESQAEHTVSCVGQGSYEAGFQKAIAAYRSNTHPALIQFFDGGTLDVMLSGAIEPVYQLMPDVDWNDYLAGARGYYESSNGELYSQPYNGSTLIFYVNKEMLGAAGVTDLPETWEEVIDAARRLKDSGEACPFTTDAHPWRIIEQFAARHAAPIASNNNGYGGLDAEYVFNTGLIADHLKNLAAWHEEGLVRLNEEVKAGNYAAAFAAGECAMMTASTGTYASAYEALGDKLAISMAPMYEGHERHNTFIGGASIYVMKGHSEKEIAAVKAFLNFIREPAQQIEFSRATGYLPVTLTALEELKSSGLSDDPAFAPATVGVDSLNQPATEDTKGIRLGFFSGARDIMIEENAKAFTGQQDMQTALDNAVQRGNELLRRFEKTYEGVELP
ncbi:extracellular solute-binding protein [Celeribacter sp.]|uniref:extracellular solute-binding protein n=1 Tax=Celeribacter sp. TaxID=1890673 RepID=UPI003A8E0A12